MLKIPCKVFSEGLINVHNTDIDVRISCSNFLPQDVRISNALQEKKIVVQQTVDSVKDRLKDMGEKYKEFVGKMEDRGNEMLERWKERSNDFVRNFIEMYGTMVSPFSQVNFLFLTEELVDQLKRKD